MGAACYFTSDLTALRLAGAAPGLAWRAETRRAEDGADLPLPVRERADQAAAFLRDALRREQQELGVVCVSVDDALCSFIASPSADPQVIAAAVRRRGAEWSRDTLGESVQALADPPRRAGLAELLRRGRDDAGDRPRSGAAHMAVLEALDGPLRLWLDALDRRGERPTTVQTLWHAIAQVWADDNPARPEAPPPLVAVAFRERPERVVWVWGRAGALVAGGSVADAPPRAADPSRAPDGEPRAEADHIDELCGRISLDWLTWTAHLGEAPTRIVVVAPDAEAISAAIQRRWGALAMRADEAPDPIGLLLRRLAEADRAGAQDDPRRSLLSATRRPARAHRRLIGVASLALALLAVAVGALGLRARQTAGDLRAESAALTARFQAVIQEAAPELVGNPVALATPVDALRSQLAQLQQASPAISEPAQPRPIKSELDRFFGALAGVEGVTLEVVSIEERTAQATVATTGFAEGESFLNRLRDTPGRIRWQGTNLGAAPNLRWRLTGTWEQDL